MIRKKGDSTRELLEAANSSRKQKYVLKLYVAGVTQKSSMAIRSITELCEEYLKGRYLLEIIDIYKQPTLAKGEQIIAAPTLIKQLPAPLRRLIGNMANKNRVLVGLDLKPRHEQEKGSLQ